MTPWFGSRRTVEVPCTVEVEHTPESLHAHVDLNGVEIEPGDTVIVHGAPAHVEFGTRVQCDAHATVIRAGWLERLWTRLTGHLEMSELCEFSFSERRRL